jgi:CRISPR-associated protein Cst2
MTPGFRADMLLTVNLFGTVLTQRSPSASYGGENELNRAPPQRVTLGQLEHAGISPAAIRNALRETLRLYGLPSKRERLHTENQPAARYEDCPDPERWADDPERWADDYFFGYFVANRGDPSVELGRGRDLERVRDTLMHLNLAVALEPYRHDVVLTQSPPAPTNTAASLQHPQTSARLHQEVTGTGLHYPFAINLGDLRLDDPAAPTGGVVRPDGGRYRTRGEQRQDWLRYLLRGISELNGVSGSHARSYYEMAPASIVLRCTDALIAGYDLYAFQPDGSIPEVVDAVLRNDFPGSEFVLGGNLVRDVLVPHVRLQLRSRGVALYRLPAQALDAVARRVTGAGFLPATPVEMA